MRLERRHALWLLIIAAHVGLLAGLAPRRPALPDATRPLVELRLLPLPRVPPRSDAAPPVPRRPLAGSLVRRTPTSPSPPEPSNVAAPTPPVPATEAENATPMPPPAPALLNSEGTRQAIRLATRTPLLSERAASASEAPARENAQQRFGREVASTAYGNCLKGEFPGGGMGLLSLPFWIAAEAGGKCKK